MEGEIVMEMELADEIYLFVEVGGKRDGNRGIKFYNRPLSKAEEMFAGGLPDGVYLTDKASIKPVEWDDKVNKPNETVRVHYMDGTHDATTYMLTTSKMAQVLDAINEAVKRGEKRIRIDLSDVRMVRVGGRDAREVTEEMLAAERNSGRDER